MCRLYRFVDIISLLRKGSRCSWRVTCWRWCLSDLLKHSFQKFNALRQRVGISSRGRSIYRVNMPMGSPKGAFCHTSSVHHSHEVRTLSRFGGIDHTLSGLLQQHTVDDVSRRLRFGHQHDEEKCKSPLSSESDIECMRQMLDSEASQLGCWPQLSECRPLSSLSFKSHKTYLRQKEQLLSNPQQQKVR
jgi:hypothetical protein